MHRKRIAMLLIVTIGLAVLVTGEQQLAASVTANANSALMVSATGQSLRGTWLIEINGKLAKTFTLRQAGDSLSGTAKGPNKPNTYNGTLTGTIKSTDRGYTVITLMEVEDGVQAGKNGPYCAAYTAKLSGDGYAGTLYDEDGRKNFEMTK